MIPVKLTIEGLYSYQERQEIDFTKLTEAGLFGIFGEVGSGKSSILEAVSFALYGETERMHSRDKRNYNMMNLKSNRMYIDFEFINYENNSFRVSREFKRNSRQFNDVKPTSVTFYEFLDEKWIPLEHTDAEKILGLNYLNFKRTIIIPQGQFKEFLELKPSDRTTMMKEIFNLHRFDLFEKTSVLKSQNKSKTDILKGQLSGLEEINEETIAQKGNEYKTQHDKLKESEKAFNLMEANFQNLKNLKSDFEALKARKREFTELENQKSNFDQKEKQLNEYELIFKTFNALLNEFRQTKKERDELESKSEKENTLLKRLGDELNELNLQLGKLNPVYEKLAEQKDKSKELARIAEIIEASITLEKSEEKQKKGQKLTKEKEDEEDELKKTIGGLEKEIDEIEKNKIPSNILLEAGNWFTELNLKQQQIENQQTKIKETEKKKDEIHKRLKEESIQTDTYESDFHQNSANLKNEKKRLEKLLSQHKIQQKLTEYANELHEGEACPLCGSTEHPDIAGHQDESEKIFDIEKQLGENELALEKLQKRYNDTVKMMGELKLAEEYCLSENSALETLKTNREKHLQTFKWKDYNFTDFQGFEKVKLENAATEETIKKLKTSLSEKRRNLENVVLDLKKYRDRLVEIGEERAELKGKIDQNLANVKILKFADYNQKPVEFVRTELNNLNQNIKQTEDSYNSLKTRLDKLSPEFSASQSLAGVLAENLQKSNAKLLEIQETIREKLKETKFENIESVQEILDLKMDTANVRQEIQNFKVDFETKRNLVSTLEDKLKDQTFDADKYDEEAQKLTDAKRQLNEFNQQNGKLLAELERLRKQFDEKKELLAESQKLEIRGKNLDILFQLFKGAGFVEYISSVYLRQLCDHANLRFHRMTRNQLSLQLNESNDFEVIDYLNEGHSRSVKTLSGGQSFQVSLSLALALAASVQSDAKAERNFFFIDEGFGTQDENAANIVFETLMNLRKENRIVGIISHVEELKEKIPVSLRIVNDAEKGSIIYES